MLRIVLYRQTQGDNIHRLRNVFLLITAEQATALLSGWKKNTDFLSVLTHITLYAHNCNKHDMDVSSEWLNVSHTLDAAATTKIF